jgi:hypothetical protein
MRNPGLLAFLAILPAACDDPSPSVGTPLSVPLVTRDGVQAGTVTVSNSPSSLRLDIDAQDGWTLEKVRAAAGTSPGLIPQTKQGQPLPESFPLRSKEDSRTSVHFAVPLTAEAGTEIVIAVYADVRDKTKETQSDCGMEPAWASGTSFPRKPDAMFFTYVIQSHQPHDLSGMYRTQTQDQWGGAASPGNAPAYLSAHFASVFPGGITIGVGPSSATFGNADDVLAFLPQFGPSLPISVTPFGNGLAGETLALALTLGFDGADPGFSSGSVPLSELRIADPADPCFGRSVREVLDLANMALAGMQGPFGINADLLQVTVQRINTNFDDGLVDLNFLGLP